MLAHSMPLLDRISFACRLLVEEEDQSDFHSVLEPEKSNEERSTGQEDH